MWKQSAEEKKLNKQHPKCCWELLCVHVRTCGRWKMCRPWCLCRVIYSAINNLTCFLLSSSPGWSGAVGAPPLLLLRFIILIICLQLLHTFPTGAWMMSKHFKQMLLLIFLMAPLKITLRAGSRRNCFSINIGAVAFDGGFSPFRVLVKTDVRSQDGVAQIYERNKEKERRAAQEEIQV